MAKRRWPRKATFIVVSSTVVAALAIGMFGGSTQQWFKDPSQQPNRAPTSASPRTARPVDDFDVQFAPAPAGVGAVATKFATFWLSYGARRDSRSAVLQRVEPIVVPALIELLRRSQRLHLSWRVLRARDERVRFTPIAVSTLAGTPPAGTPVTVDVRGLTRTTTMVATITTPQSIQLQLTPSDNGWRVIKVHGGGA